MGGVFLELTLERYQRLTSRIFSCAIEPNQWVNVLDGLGEALDGAKMHLFGHDISAELNLGFLTSGHDPEMVQAFTEYFGDRNPYPAAAGPVHAGAVRNLDEIIPEAEIKRTEYYNDFMRPQENLTGGVGSVLESSEGSMFVIGTLHPNKLRDKLDEDAIALLRRLAPELSMAWRLSKISAGHALMADRIMPNVPQGLAAIVDCGGWPHYVTPAGERALADGRHLRSDARGRIIPGRSKSLDAWDSVLENARRKDTVPTVSSIPSNAGHVIRILPLHPDGVEDAALGFPLGLGNGMRLMIVLDKTTYGEAVEFVRLTPAERDVTYALAQGLDIQEIAHSRAVSIHTVRNQIKSAMAKCSVSRQSQLVAIALRHE